MTDNNTPFKKFICRSCGHIYDEAVGDPSGGVPANTPFEALAQDWACPLCGVAKTDFELDEHLGISTKAHAGQGVVIVGAGLAGWAVVDALRALDEDIAITLISADSADRYHKPMLSVAISQNKSRADLVRATGVQSAQDKNITLLADTRVLGIDPNAKILTTDAGKVAYDKLVLATGSLVAYPPTIKEAWHVNHLDEFTQLQERLSYAKTVAIIGAGMVGVELAEDLANAGLDVHLIDVSDYPLSAMFPSVVGERLLSAIGKLGVQWHGGCRVDSLGSTGTGCQSNLTDAHGQTYALHTDEVIVATGLMIDEELPKQAGVLFDKKTGIVVNPQTLQTDNPDIYALGDCVSIDGVPCRYVAPHRPQATAIAHEILSLPHAGYAHKPPMIRLKNKSINITANGNPKGAGNWQITQDEGNELLLVMMENGAEVARVSVKS